MQFKFRNVSEEEYQQTLDKTISAIKFDSVRRTVSVIALTVGIVAVAFKVIDSTDQQVVGG